MLILAYCILAVLLLATLAFAIGVQKYYADSYETQTLSTVFTVISFFLLLTSLFLLPIDIYNISRNASVDEKREARDELANIYYVVYILLLINSFVFVPFAYFYHEEENLAATIKSKVLGALKYTILFVVVLIVLMVVGLFLRDRVVTGADANMAWVTSVMADQQHVLYAVCFAVASFTAMGVCLWIVYTGYGLAAMPLRLLLLPPSPLQERERLAGDEEALMAESRAFQAKFALTGRAMTEHDRQTLERLRQRERAVKRRTDELDSMYDSFFAKLSLYLRPFVRLIGLIALAFSSLLWISWAVGGADKIENSTCGWKCGFLAGKSTLPNPIDWLLVMASRIFPLDFVLLVLIVLYIFFASFSALISLGVRAAWILMYRISPRATSPQALLIVAAYMTLIIFVLTVQVPTLAPRYSTFGTQGFEVNGEFEYCSNENAPHDQCVRSQLSLLVLQMITKSQFFAVFFFFANWMFLLFSFASGVWFIFQAQRQGEGRGLMLSEYDTVRGDDDI